ncbi:hypothetical protein DZB84_16330 [Bacillus sp. HNG]|uniref:hypothetical protein n=1 Tax=Bacillus sp. HNG TaxID=2293325 RepID=UPI000E2EF680|nr:hypothetical protein [Bacillus sp. HNG]RFB13539.1 hypothetical protein DZB84_16330 [Bacillus sp. HNG]
MKQILVAFALAIILAGCQSQQTAPVQHTDDVDNKPPQQAADEENAEPFEVDTTSYQNGKLTIHYPQLVNMQNEELEQRINNRIKEDAILFLNQYQDGDAPLKMDYEVILPESDTFSVQYTGNYNGGMYPTHLLFTTNIDFKKGEKIRLPDLFVIDEPFIETLKKAKYIDWENPPDPNKEKQDAIIEYLNTFNNQDLIKAFHKADHPDPNENPYGIFSYFLNHTVVISIQVPHALGDHAEFEVNTRDWVRK